MTTKIITVVAGLAITSAIATAQNLTPQPSVKGAQTPAKIVPQTAPTKRYIISFYHNKSLNKLDKLQQKQLPSPGSQRVFDKQGFSTFKAKSLVESYGANVIGSLNKLSATVAELDEEQLKTLRANPQVRLIEEDMPRSIQGQTSPYGMAMVQANQLSDATIANMKVCIVDTGYDLSHEDLPKGANITGEISNTLTIPIDLGQWSSDVQGHGTHVAGTLAALNNDIGIAGVTPGGAINLHIVKVVHKSNYWQYFASDMIDAVERCQLAGANIINMSLAGDNASVAEKTAMDTAWANGVLMFGAAGNRGNNDYYYPASYDSVISVGAVDSAANAWTYTQSNDKIELTAPGVGIHSTIPGNRYSTWDGTSMATPYAAGSAALVWSLHPDCSNNQIRQALKDSALDKGTPGLDPTYGYGVVQAKAAADLLTASGCPDENPPTQSTTYTDPEDFDEAEQSNVSHDGNGQIVLSDEASAFDVIWIAASGRGTIVKLNTLTGDILGEYLSAPNGHGRNPSRTTVDGNGSVWATNRNDSVGGKGSVVHIGSIENNQCVDRNGNGIIETSTGLGDIKTWLNGASVDSNGGVTTAVDECIIHFTRISSTGARHISVDKNNNIWASGTSSRVFDLIDGNSGQIIRTEASVGYGGYGGLIDDNDVIWSAAPFLRWDTTLPLTGANGTNWTGLSHDSYGLCIDKDNNVWNTALNGNIIRKFAPDGELLGAYNHGGGRAQGCAVDQNNEIWIAHSVGTSTSVSHMANYGALIGTVPLLGGVGPTGIAVDKAGKVWTTNYNSNTASRIDPAAGPTGAFGLSVGAVDMTVGLGGSATPYNYSDMTGSVQSVIPNIGALNIVHDNGIALPAALKKSLAGKTTITQVQNPDTDTVVSWTATEPGNSSIVVTAKSSTDGVNFGVLETLTNGGKLSIATDRYLRLSFSLTRSSTTFDSNGLGHSPALADITISAVPVTP